MKQTKLLTLRGKVQGVGFREAMVREAIRLGVTGWVRNRHDGSVEATISGDAEQLAAIIDWAHRGPPMARVLRVDVSDDAGSFRAFVHYPTA